MCAPVYCEVGPVYCRPTKLSDTIINNFIRKIHFKNGKRVMNAGKLMSFSFIEFTRTKRTFHHIMHNDADE